MYRVLINYCVFSLKFSNFSELCQFCCSAGVLPAWCVYTHWQRGKTEKSRVRNILKSSKKTQYLMNPLYIIVALNKNVTTFNSSNTVLDLVHIRKYNIHKHNYFKTSEPWNLCLEDFPSIFWWVLIRNCCLFSFFDGP